MKKIILVIQADDSCCEEKIKDDLLQSDLILSVALL